MSDRTNERKIEHIRIIDADPDVDRHKNYFDRIRLIHRALPEVEAVHWFLGESAPPFYYNMLPKRSNASAYAQAMVQIRPGVAPGRSHHVPPVRPTAAYGSRAVRPPCTAVGAAGFSRSRRPAW